MAIQFDNSARNSLKKLRKSDVEAAEKIQKLIDQVEAGTLPEGSTRMTAKGGLRRQFGTLPFKVACGKLRMIFLPTGRIIAVGYRRDIYTMLEGNGWGN